MAEHQPHTPSARERLEHQKPGDLARHRARWAVGPVIVSALLAIGFMASSSLVRELDADADLVATIGVLKLLGIITFGAAAAYWLHLRRRAARLP